MGRRLEYTHPSLRGKLDVPGDKSISHRAVMFGSVAEGVTTISHFLEGEDCLSTIDCFRKLGVTIEQNRTDVKVYGKGFAGLRAPSEVLDVGNSGTSIRLLLGLLAALPFDMTFTGDESIAQRPMKRVVGPLRQMGAQISGRDDGNLVPLTVKGSVLKGIEYVLPVASAQVKSAILLAGLQAEGETTVIEKERTRDHTEKMIQSFGGKISVDGLRITVEGGQSLKGGHINVPGDISSAAFWLAAGAIVPGSEITIKNVGMNPTRTGIIDVLQDMGADMDIILNEETGSGEEVGTITIRHSQLHGTTIGGDIIPRLIDEIPIISLMATQAKGQTIIKNAEELKVKETNRIDAIATQLGRLGAEITPTEDGLIIKGEQSLSGGTADSLNDHRIGMTLCIASLLTDGPVELENEGAISISYPSFFDDLERLIN
ncbi:3-phosphoshikimate 1-carboxyvinyltransferase [Pradoshia sp.]